MLAYTPSGEDGSSRRYPALCLFHGDGDTIDSRAREGRGPEILDNRQSLGSAVQ